MARGKRPKRSAKRASKGQQNEPKASTTASASPAPSSDSREHEILERLKKIGNYQDNLSTPASQTESQGPSIPKIFDPSATTGEVSADLTARVETYISIKKCELLFALSQWILSGKRNDAVDELLDIGKAKTNTEIKAANATIPGDDVPSNEVEGPGNSSANENAPATGAETTSEAATEFEAENGTSTEEKVQELESRNQALTLQLQEQMRESETLKHCCRVHHELFQELKGEYIEAAEEGLKLLHVYKELEELYKESAHRHGEPDERFQELSKKFYSIF
ncbi:uncharacterized protein DSM5745_09205 [Aspergillus mulundensis]|uniref:Uncharacterized protein n=1 Tax=Aspergillus mulundensis TaxID=1810919 RepID=A0A3D8QZX1_9EURO|nr:hypothetical protein DSM5745_09205 [Aspergillus mulundensis]RDW67339.1 hypothetical protein DSM5745_09205 [Aspergillus mulundensis]